MRIREWIRLVEQEINTGLDDLYRERDALIKRWDTIKVTRPEAHDTGLGYSIQTPELTAWESDPERGGMWTQRIYPLNQKIEQLEKKTKQDRRTKALTAKRGTDEGFDTSEILYHGTDAEFETFDRAKTKTAAHIYTSPDIDTANEYGINVYAVYGRQEPQAVLTAEDMDYDLVKRVHRKGAFRKNWGLSLNELTELISNAELYSWGSNSRLQDYVIDTCFELKFRSVRITDGIPGSHGYSDSVIFDNASDLQIVEKVE